MEVSHQRKLKSGAEYDYLFPKANGNEETLKWDANVYDTLDFIPKIVYKTLNDTKALSKLLKGKSLYETCNKIWDFVYNHIQYNKDEDGVEQLRRPARSWMDRVRGVDCDCYTVFISSILTNLNIPHTYRITKYHYKTNFQHIYPIVPTTDGHYITIDAVVNKFNYEEPFTKKHDSPMNLTYLNGIEPNEDNTLMAITMDTELANLPTFEEVDGLGKVKFGTVLKKIAHGANIANPGMAVLRLGVLASMKLNMFHLAKNLRYAYLTDEQAKEQGIDLEKLKHLRKIHKKMEDIFYGAGGSLKVLKKEILTSKGNKDHSVKGFEDDYLYGIDDFDEHTPLAQLLAGFYDEESGTNGLGVIATSAAIASVSTVLATMAGLVAKLGVIKKGVDNVTHPNSANSSNGNGTDYSPTATDATVTPDDPNQPDVNAIPQGANTSGRYKAPFKKPAPATIAPVETLPATTTTILPATTTVATLPDTTAKLTFSETATTWMKDNKTAIIVGTVVAAAAVIALVEVRHYRKHHPKLIPKPTQTPSLSGTPKTRKKKRGKKDKKSAIALL
jgi:hypothetical protein